MVLSRARRKRIIRRKKSPVHQKNKRKYACGCYIMSSDRCNAFFVSLCDYHRGEMNTTSASLSQLADKIKKDEADIKKRVSH